MARSTPERRSAVAFSRNQHPADALLSASSTATAPAPAADANGGKPEPAEAQPAAPPAPAPISVTADEGKKQFVVRLPPSVHEALRKANFELREPMQAIAERGIVAELKRLGFTP